MVRLAGDTIVNLTVHIYYIIHCSQNLA